MCCEVEVGRGLRNRLQFLRARVHTRSTGSAPCSECLVAEGDWPLGNAPLQFNGVARLIVGYPRARSLVSRAFAAEQSLHRRAVARFERVLFV